MTDLCETCGAYWRCDHREDMERVANAVWENYDPPTPEEIDHETLHIDTMYWKRLTSLTADNPSREE